MADITVAGRVATGVAFLDEHDPGWWRADIHGAIDLDHLELANPEHCILGQRCPAAVLAEYCYLSENDEDALSAQWWRAYTAYAMELSGLRWDTRALAAWGDAHGFSDGAGIGEDYPALTAEWHRVITTRRLAAAL